MRDILTPRAASAKVSDRDSVLALTDEAIDARVGMVVDDKYRVTRLIGRGGMGCVYEAEHTLPEHRVAIKFILPEYASNRETVRRFHNEAVSAGHLDHVNIAAVVDHGSAPDGSPYVVTEYLVGQDCGQMLSTVGSVPIERACDIVYQACVGMSVAHQSGIVHRDIKPGNLFITRAADGTDLVKILDFGIAKLRVPGANALGGSENGSLGYMAPEQVRDAGKVDGRADIWALGTVLYELLTRRRPFEGADAASVVYQISFEQPEPPNDLRPELPVELVSAIDLALEKDPEKRFETVLALADAIGPFTGRPLSRCSKLALSQRPPLLTPVDAAYDTTQTGISVLTNAPVSRSLMTSRQRAYRVYTLLGVAALVGFGVGGLTRRVVNQNRAAAAASDADYVLAVAGSQAPTVASPSPPAVVQVAPVQTDAGVPLAAEVRPTVSPSGPGVAALTAPQNAPMRLVRVSPDGGTLKAMVERADAPGAVPAVSSSKQPEMLSARVSAPKSSAVAPESTAPVPARPESATDPSNTDDTDNPL